MEFWFRNHRTRIIDSRRALQQEDIALARVLGWHYDLIFCVIFIIRENGRGNGDRHVGKKPANRRGGGTGRLHRDLNRAAGGRNRNRIREPLDSLVGKERCEADEHDAEERQAEHTAGGGLVVLFDLG
jgi:hypothetical protein